MLVALDSNYAEMSATKNRSTKCRFALIGCEEQARISWGQSVQKSVQFANLYLFFWDERFQLQLPVLHPTASSAWSLRSTLS